MIETRLLTKQSLQTLFEALRASGQRIIAPRTQGNSGPRFVPVESLDQVDLETLTRTSGKSGVFPCAEEILRYRADGKRIKIEDNEIVAPETVLFGLRPCDARAFTVLDAVFLSDPADVFFQARREATILVALSCATADLDCFCTSVGGGPGSTEGADLLLTAMSEDQYLVEIVTEKGRRLVDLRPDLFEPGEKGDKERRLAAVPVRFELGDVTAKLPALFNREELWREQALCCLGCGTCAFVCPTCSCFDIQEESDLRGGVRLRCWDSCGQKLFTLHASGHNPRATQSQRWRQRIMHKFSYLPERAGLPGCVGCGRCSRACPAGISLVEHLMSIAETEA